MAARENQGLQIAVMIFFLLVVVLAVTTYLFFSDYDSEHRAKLDLEEKLKTQTAASLKAVQEANDMKELIGFEPTDTVDVVKKEFANDMKKYSVGYEGKKQVYREILEAVYADKEKILKDKTESLDRELVVKKSIDDVKDTNEKSVTELEKSADSLTKDLEGERSKFNEERQRVTTGADNVAKQLEAKRNEMTEAVAKLNAVVRKLQETTKKQADTIANIQHEDKAVANVERPDGKVTWVNTRTREVSINLGQADGLNPQTVFTVNDSSGDKKGSIEVLRIVDRHMADARILDDSLSDPILPGDTIQSPVWQKGQHASFGLAGIIDLNGDSVSDREMIRDLIITNGGKLDVELLEDGKISGKLKGSTRYLILGDPPSGKKENDEMLNNYSALVGEAKQFNVQTIAVSKFIDLMGWDINERMVTLGKGARAEDFKAKPPENVPHRSTAPKSDFKKRPKPTSTF